MILPTLILSVLLFTVGLAAAGYVYVWNARVSKDLDDKLSAILILDELVSAIRDCRIELIRFAQTGDPNYWLESKRASSTVQEQLQSEFAGGPGIRSDTEIGQQLLNIMSQVSNLEPEQASQAEVLVHELSSGPLKQASEMLANSRTEVSRQSSENRLLAGRIGISLAVLGMCGATAGLLVGFGVARGVARSIEQLSGSLYSAAESLSSNMSKSTNRPRELPEIIAAASDVRDRAVGIANELEKSRENAARADQLAAVGQLAAGIAHELRNPLTAVKLLVDTSRERDESLGGQYLNVVQEEVNRMAEMLQTFLDFARPPNLIRQPIALSNITQQAIELVRLRASRLGIAIHFQDDAGVLASADPQQLRQVVLNLLLNAIDAQPGGGEVVVKILRVLKNDASSTAPPEEGTREQMRLCAIEIADNGPGIAPEIRDRLFEPFVSTKETGIGLGLAICRRIVESHDGMLIVSDRFPSGATFRLELPLIDLPS